MIISVRVRTGRKSSKIVRESDYRFTMDIKSNPERGKANREIIEMFSGYFNLPKKSISIKSGLKAKIKIISVG